MMILFSFFVHGSLVSFILFDYCSVVSMPQIDFSVSNFSNHFGGGESMLNCLKEFFKNTNHFWRGESMLICLNELFKSTEPFHPSNEGIMDAAEQNKYNIRQMAAFSSSVLNLFQSLFACLFQSLIFHSVSIFTARKQSFRRLCYYRCLSVRGGGGGMRGCRGTCMARGACVAKGCCVWQRGACMVRGCAWDMTRYGDTINERAVRILLECILLCFFFENV